MARERTSMEYATAYEDNNYQTHRKEYCILGATRYRQKPVDTGRWITAIGCFRTIEEARDGGSEEGKG